MRPAHHMIHVQYLARAIAFYERALDFVEVDRHHYDSATIVYMRGTDSAFELELLCPETWPYDIQPESGRAHIAFTVVDLDAEHQHLTSHGFAVDPVSDYVANGIHQTRYFYFYDPEGNQIEFLEPHGRYATERI